MISCGLNGLRRKNIFQLHLYDFAFEKDAELTIILERSLLPELARKAGNMGVHGLLMVLVPKEKCIFTGRFGINN